MSGLGFPADSGIPPEPIPGDSAGSVLNLAYLNRQFHHKQRHLDLLIQDFDALVADVSGQLVNVIEHNDYSAYRDLLHELYAAAGTLGATLLETVCHQASVIPPSQLAERKTVLLADVDRTIRATREALARYGQACAGPCDDSETVGEATPSSHSAVSRKTLLLVDDNPLIRRQVREIVEADFHLSEATTGQEALRQCAQASLPDVVILDLKLTLRQEEGDASEPKLSGLEVARRLPPTLPFIVLTADRSRDTRRAAMAAGACGYCVKPPEPDPLLAALDVALFHAEAQRQREQAYTQELAIHYAAGVLAALNQLDQVDAHQLLRRMASMRRQKLVVTAQAVIDANASRLLLYPKPDSRA